MMPTATLRQPPFRTKKNRSLQIWVKKIIYSLLGDKIRIDSFIQHEFEKHPNATVHELKKKSSPAKKQENLENRHANLKSPRPCRCKIAERASCIHFNGSKFHSRARFSNRAALFASAEKVPGTVRIASVRASLIAVTNSRS